MKTLLAIVLAMTSTLAVGKDKKHTMPRYKISIINQFMSYQQAKHACKIIPGGPFRLPTQAEAIAVHKIQPFEVMTNLWTWDEEVLGNIRYVTLYPNAAAATYDLEADNVQVLCIKDLWED